MRDFQKSRVYKFEDRYVAPLDNIVFSIKEAQEFINFVWEGEGYDCPPRVSQNTRYKVKLATGGRFNIQTAGNTIKRWILIHELTHSICQTLDEDGEVDDSIGHGPKFVSTYLKLLDRYANINMIGLLAMCNKSKVKVEGLIS